jgi:transcriptional regulator with XRE-family HTH domain
MDPATLVRETVLVPRKTPRPPGPDDWAAERIRHEREQRGWSTAELARQVTLVGVPMLQQTVWKIESGTPRRKISVGEAAAFAYVFRITLGELMTPPAGIAHKLVQLAVEFRDWRLDEGRQMTRLARIADQVAELSDDDQHAAEIAAKSAEWMTSDQAIADIENMITDFQDVLAEIRAGGSAWSVIASAVDVVPPAVAGEG